MSNRPLLHLYAQEQWHFPAFVVGDRAGLKALRAAIDRALKAENGLAYTDSNADYLCTADGEGYVVHIMRLDDDWQSPLWQTLTPPYTDAPGAPVGHDPATVFEERGGRVW